MPNDHLTVTKNPSYWQKDKDGNKLPYLDQITFRPVDDVSQRVNGLKGGDLDLIHLTDGQQITRAAQRRRGGHGEDARDATARPRSRTRC